MVKPPTGVIGPSQPQPNEQWRFRDCFVSGVFDWLFYERVDIYAYCMFSCWKMIVQITGEAGCCVHPSTECVGDRRATGGPDLKGQFLVLSL